MQTLIEVEVVETGSRVWLPMDIAQRWADLGRVRLPAPMPDARYSAPAKLPLSQSWQAGKFWPTPLQTRRH